jgi:hypothetical protein
MSTTAPTGTRPGPCVEGIAETLRVLLGSELGIEIRAPDCFDGKTVVRRFDPGAYGAAATAAATLSGKAPAVYVVMNGVDPGAPAGKGGAKAGDVPRRRWVLIDCDRVKPKGETVASATDGEKAAAYAVTTTIRKALTALGWPEPLEADSGNGYHLLYRVDLPNDGASSALVKAVLEALAAGFNTEAARVDTAVHDAPRLVKLYGTLVCKGDHTPERPHRWAELRYLPHDIEQPNPVPVELLEALATEAATPTPAAEPVADPEPPPATGKAGRGGWEVLPGADFNVRADWGRDVLTGWTRVYTHGRTEYWRRPGKDRGHSATVNHLGTDRLHVFTSSSEFASGESYSRFGAYARLHHGGDHAAAARALYQAGYGTHKRWVEDGGRWVLRVFQNPCPKGHRVARPGEGPPGEVERGEDKAPVNGEQSPPPNGRSEAAPGEPVNRTDLGNARRLVHRFGNGIRYCHPWKAWLVWDGRRWLRDQTGAVTRMAKKTVQAIADEALGCDDDDERKAALSQDRRFLRIARGQFAWGRVQSWA